ncbi:MAG: hypothetical protein PHP83_02570 [Clostridia bacterium]|nr:hypothetical protein [Clostridia bacterium]
MKDDNFKNKNFSIQNNRINVKTLTTRNGEILCSLNQSIALGYDDYYEEYPTGCLVCLKEPDSKAKKVLFYNNNGDLIMDLDNTTKRGEITFDEVKIFVDDDGVYAEKYLKNKMMKSEYFSYSNEIDFDHIAKTEKYLM